MPRRSSPPLPRVERVLADVGHNIKIARTRRGLAAGLVAERAGMSRPTLRAIERGDPSVTVGALANVLNTLGLVDDLSQLARADELGRQLEDAKLDATQRVRARKPR